MKKSAPVQSQPNQKTNNKNTLAIVIGSVCIAGFLAFLNYPAKNEATDKVATQVTEKAERTVDTTTRKSASEMVEAAAQQRLKGDAQERKSFPNVTPTVLEKPFSPTLVGTDIDGQIRVDDTGKVVVDLAVKDFFDYFLSAVGEVSAELALDELMRVISESLPPENAQEAVALLDNYLAYKEAAVDLLAQPMLPRDQQSREYQLQVLEDSLSQLKALRRAHMPEAQVAAFFGMEEAYEEYTIAAIKIQFDETLSSEEKAQLINYQRSLLPEEIRNTEVRVTQEQERNTEVHQALTSNDEAALQATLEQKGYTAEEQEQVLQHQRQQKEFDRRYAAYVNAKSQRLHDVSSVEEKQRIIEVLQQQFFESETEITQARVRDLKG